jgi:hypothetical protein
MNMNNEETKLINNELNQKNAETKPEEKKKKSISKAGLSAGAFAAGAGVGYAAISADKLTDDSEASAEGDNEATTDSNAESPENTILANEEDIRYAHVDADNFNDAFAQARAQVGAGGVFEYNGKLYGTYTSDEWNAMTDQEKIDYQNRVNEVAPTHHTPLVEPTTTSTADTIEVQAEPTNVEYVSTDHVDNEIRVLGVEAVSDDEGHTMNVALVECEGDQAMMVDVDNDGTIDVIVHDDNNDGILQESEIVDISGAGIEVSDLAQAQAATDSGLLYASNDDMPDYINDADTTGMI